MRLQNKIGEFKLDKDLEKINIYVPHNYGLQLERDAALFGFYKKSKQEKNTDKSSINMNRFLSAVIMGYYSEYYNENKLLHDNVLSILNSITNEALREELTIQIVNQVSVPDIPKRKGKKPIRLSLKPTYQTELVIKEIMKDVSSNNDFISQYFCRLLISYCEKPINIREQIVFKESYDKIQIACNEHRSITFVLKSDSKHVFEIIPFSITPGHEEMFNYVIGESNSSSGNPYAVSVRLNRIDHLSYGKVYRPIDETIRTRCEKMVKYAPQYAINNDEEIIVRLDNSGVDLYNNKIYHDRPVYDRTEDRDDGHYYFFSCSQLQVYNYFRRFSGTTAVIVSPIDLAQKMYKFHLNACREYATVIEENSLSSY